MGKEVELLGSNTIEMAAGGTRWRLKLWWGDVDGRAEVVELELRPAPGHDIRPITTSVIRNITASAINAERVKWAKALARAKAPDAHRERARRRGIDAFTSARRRDLTEQALAAVARVYREAWRSGRNPTEAVADAFHITPSAAAKRVARAREAGHLPKTTRGRPKGDL